MTSSNGNGLVPTSAAEIKQRNEEGVIIPLLNSNFTARIGPVNLERMIASGQIPDLLTNVAASSLLKGDTIDSLIESPELFKNYVEIFDIVMPAVFKEPKMALAGMEPAEDEITVDHVHHLDKAFIFNHATAGVRSLELFRDEQIKYAKAIQDVQSNGDKAVRPRKRRK